MSLISTDVARARVETMEPGCSVTVPTDPSLIWRSVAVTPVTFVGLSGYPDIPKQNVRCWCASLDHLDAEGPLEGGFPFHSAAHLEAHLDRGDIHVAEPKLTVLRPIHLICE